MPKPHVLGTHLELADKNIARYAEKVKNGEGNPEIVREKLDQWLEYRFQCQRDGTIDDLAVL